MNLTLLFASVQMAVHAGEPLLASRLMDDLQPFLGQSSIKFSVPNITNAYRLQVRNAYKLSIDMEFQISVTIETKDGNILNYPEDFPSGFQPVVKIDTRRKQWRGEENLSFRPISLFAIRGKISRKIHILAKKLEKIGTVDDAQVSAVKINVYLMTSPGITGFMARWLPTYDPSPNAYPVPVEYAELITSGTQVVSMRWQGIDDSFDLRLQDLSIDGFTIWTKNFIEMEIASSAKFVGGM